MYISKNKIAGFFTKNNDLSIIVASLIGVMSPLGSYVQIPLSAALFFTGVPLPVLMALMMSSPLINPNLFILTTGTFGLHMALARVISAFILGVVAGYATDQLLKNKWLQINNIVNKETEMWVKNDNETEPGWKLFGTELLKMTKFISKYFFLAIIFAAAIKILVNPIYIIRIFGGNSFLSVLLSTGAGIPFYVCGGAAIPIVQQLAELGMNKGSVLAFFISGPATKISNLIILKAAFNIKIFLIYILTAVLGAFLFGIVYNIT